MNFYCGDNNPFCHHCSGTTEYYIITGMSVCLIMFECDNNHSKYVVTIDKRNKITIFDNKKTFTNFIKIYTICLVTAGKVNK